MKQVRGFTLIELVIIIVILGILAAVALPRFMDLSSDADTASVQGTAGALGSAMSSAHGKWLAAGEPVVTTSAGGTGIQLGDSTSNYTGFNSTGWPIGSKATTPLALTDVIGGGGTDASLCATIMSDLLSSSSVSVSGASPCTAAIADYCATYAASVCTYTYQSSTSNTITYNTGTGAIVGP